MAKHKKVKTARMRRAEFFVKLFFFEPELVSVIHTLDANIQAHGGPGDPPVHAALAAAAHWLRADVHDRRRSPLLGVRPGYHYEKAGTRSPVRDRRSRARRPVAAAR
jgi:hypothetical protein